jgi:arylsulfatase A-like enzyme
VPPERSAIILMVDGLDRTCLRELLGQGRLPNIQSMFIEGGVIVENAVSSLPPSTYPNTTTLLTGRHPGHHGILGNAWFDRETREWTDYRTLATYLAVNDDLHSSTIYDLLTDELTVNVQTHVRRGANVVIDNSFGFVAAYAMKLWSNTDARVMAEFENVIRLANRKKRWPALTFMYFLGIDEIGHRQGSGSQAYAQAVCEFDRCLGWLAAILDQQCLATSSYLLLVSDHGMVPREPGNTFEIDKWLMDCRNMSIHHVRVHESEAIVIPDAGRVANIHLRGQRGWNTRPQPSEVTTWVNAEPRLQELPSVALVAIRDGPNRVRAMSSRGSAVIERRIIEGKREYRVAEYVGDPFRSSQSEAWLAAGWQDSEEWLGMTAGEDSEEWLGMTAGDAMPDLIAQLVELFDSPRTGDVMVFAEEGWVFERENRGGHGSCLARDMHPPMLFAGPDLPAGGTIPHARLVDLMPTVLGLLGKADRLNGIDPIDGINRAEQLRHRSLDQRN